MLRLQNITKTFPGVRALDDVSVELFPGECHGLVGENGAGKSTLMAIAAGALRADAGEVVIAGETLDRVSPKVARELGLAIVYQEPALLPDLTIAENFWLSTRDDQRPKRRDLERWVAEALGGWTGREIPPTLPLRELGADVRFIVEISKALAQRPRILILDEPTEHLPAEDVEVLFERIASLTAAGTAVMYISHRIADVRRISDRISVLRDGVLQGTFRAQELSEGEIINKIVGRPLELAFPAKADPADLAGSEALVDVSGFSGRRFAEFDLQIRAGEIVGLAGIEGNGQRDVMRALAGLEAAKGSIRVGATTVRAGDNAAAGQAGIAYIPGDRHTEGIFPTLDVRENISLKSIGDLVFRGVVNRSAERRWAGEQVDRYGIRPATLDTTVDSLSGGNQQKAVIARTLATKPKLILADEPTQGVDVGARLEIYRFLREAVGDGAAAVVVSSDGAELEGLCDRVIVMSRGHAVAELTGEQVTEYEITRAALTSTTSRGQAVTERVDTSLRRFLRGDYAPSAVLALVILLLGAYTATQSSAYLTGRNFSSLLALFAALAFVSMAQQVVLLAGGIDLSVGPLAGFLLVVGSFVLTDGTSGGLIILGLLALVAIAITVGVLNWVPSLAGVSPLMATLVTFTGLQGLSLLLRPLPGGEISIPLTDAISSTIGWVPVAAIVAVALGLALEYVLRRTLWGVRLRAIGSRPAAAHEVGVNVRLVLLSAYVVAALLAFLTSLMLMSQIGSGDPTAGTNYTLLSITAAVLGGASLFGGRGAFVGAILGALLIQQINTSVVFLGLDGAWQTYLVGILTLAAAGFYSKARDVTA